MGRNRSIEARARLEAARAGPEPKFGKYTVIQVFLFWALPTTAAIIGLLILFLHR